MSEEMDKAIHAAVRKTLQHHKLTEVGNAVVEADLIHAVLSNHNSADKIDWLKKGVAEWRDAALQETKLRNASAATARIAIGHLHAVLNKARTHHEQQASDTAARDWLASIGSEPT